MANKNKKGKDTEMKDNKEKAASQSSEGEVLRRKKEYETEGIPVERLHLCHGLPMTE